MAAEPNVRDTAEKQDSNRQWTNIGSKCVNSTPRRKLSVIHWLGIAVAVGIVALLVFGETTSDARKRVAREEQAKRMTRLLSMTREYYGHDEVGAGTFGTWKVKSIRADEKNPLSESINSVIVTLVVDRSVADDILWRTSEGRLRAAANGCPPRSNAVYEVLSNNDNLMLEVVVDGSIFVDVDCARWAGNTGLPGTSRRRAADWVAQMWGKRPRGA